MSTEIILQRKSIVQTCKAVIKYMEVEDGREEIDTLLDEAACALANVSQKMHDYWVRALMEREAEEARQAGRSYARSHAKVKKITRQELSARKQLDKLMKVSPALVRSLIKEQLSSEEESDVEMEEIDSQEEAAVGKPPVRGNGPGAVLY